MANLTDRQKKISKLKTSGDVFLYKELERLEKKLPDLKQLITLLIGEEAVRTEKKDTDIKKKLAKLSDDSDFFLLKEIQALEEQIPDIVGLATSFQLKQPEKGDKGDTGATGESIKGDKGEDGKVGLDGKDGKNGEDGLNGLDGVDGKNGLDGNTITSEEIVEKINTLEEVVDYSVLKNVPDLKALENNIRMAIPRTIGGGGTNEVLEDGVKVGSSHRLNFGAGLDVTMTDGTINIVADLSEVPEFQDLQSVTDLGATTTNAITITDEGLITDYVDFDLTPLSTIQEGRMQWDADENTAVIGMTGGNVNLQVGQESLVHVINKSGADIANGKLVYSTGSQGNVLTIDLADNTDSDKIHILGMATENIANNATGYVSTFGKVRGTGTQPIDTSAFTEGDKLYLNSAGGWTKTHPSGATDAVIIFGHVLRVHATTGIIQMSNPEPFTIGNNFDGILRQSVINQNTGTSASSAFTAVNNAGHRSSLSMVGSNYTVVAGIAEAMVLYNQGYNKTVFAVDGNYGYEWWTDVTDSHNLSSTSKMSLSAAGALKIEGLTASKIVETDGSKLLVSSSLAVSDLVPYTGADTAVDLGSQTFTTTGALASGTQTVTGNVVPEADGTRDLGVETTAQWANLWVDNVNGIATGTGYSYLTIWAEESAATATNAYEWSYGNGDEAPSGTGIIIPADCELFSIGTTTSSADTTFSVSVYKNGVLAASSGVHSGNSTLTTLGATVSFSAGDVMDFRTLTTGSQSAGTRVAANFQVPFAGLKGDQGDPGDISTASDSSEIDFTVAAGDITASLITGSIDVLKLDAGVQTSLGLADSSLQNIVEDLSPQLGANLDGQAFNITTTGLGTFGSGLITSGTSGDAVLTIESDTDNSNEADNPYIQFKQDGALVVGGLGLTDLNVLPDGTSISGVTTNSLVLYNKFTAGVDIAVGTTSIANFDATNISFKRDLDMAANGVTTTGLGTFGNLDVDTLNLNGNVISDSTGTVSFDNDHITTTGTVTAEQLTSTDDAQIAGLLKLGTTDGEIVIEGSTAGNARGAGSVDIQLRSLADKVVTAAGAVAYGIDNKITGGSQGGSTLVGIGNTESGYGKSSIYGIGNTNAGYLASCFGFENNTGSGYRDTLVGYQNTITGARDDSTVVGASNGVSNANTTTIGKSNTNSGLNATAIGFQNTASAVASSSIGKGNTASSNYSTAAGYFNSVTGGGGSTAVGANNIISSGGQHTACGYGHNISGQAGGTAVGYSHALSGQYVCTSIGYNNTNSGSYAISIGNNLTTSSSYSVEIGPANTTKIRLNGGNLLMLRDNAKTLYGAGNDASVYYDGTNMVIDPKEVGSGYLEIQGDVKVNERLIRSKSVYTGTDTTDDVSLHICDSASTFTLTVTDGATDGEEMKIMNRGAGTVTLSGKISTVTADTTLLEGETIVMNWDVSDDQWQ